MDLGEEQEVVVEGVSLGGEVLEAVFPDGVTDGFVSLLDVEGADLEVSAVVFCGRRLPALELEGPGLGQERVRTA